MWGAPKGAYYIVENRECYMGNIKIHVYKPNGVEAFYTIEDTYNVEGYCHCLEEFGFERKNENED